MTLTTITVTTSNICGNPLRPLTVVRDRIKQAADFPGVNFGQEIDPGNPGYSQRWKNVMSAHGKVTYGQNHEVPISASPRYVGSVNNRTRCLHGGKARVSPARYLTSIEGFHQGFPVAFDNMHTVSKPRLGVKSARWRMDKWDEYHHEAQAIIAEQVEAGYTVFYGGDLNRRARRIPKFHPNQHMLIQSGLDHLYLVPAEGVTFKVVGKRKIRRTRLMDHPILSVTVELRRSES